ncbi:MAG: hypothetical protein VX938_03300 [Myxococcota bacterium]|nr:hypothetical protein [Myxococcota bacterium]
MISVAPRLAPPPQLVMWRGCIAWALMGESLELARRAHDLLCLPGAPTGGEGLTALQTTPGVLWGVVAVVWIAAVAFARGAARWLPLGLALIGTGFLYGALTGAKDDVPEFLVHGGVLGTGWLLGLVGARLCGASTETPEGAHAREQLAWRGAIGALAATYVKAGLAKLSAAGLGWVDPLTLRSIVLAHYDPTGPELRLWLQDLLLNSPGLSAGLLGYGLIAELGAVALLTSGRWRMLWSAVLINFHVGVFAVTTDILFFTALMFLFILGWRVYPLERLFTRLLGPGPGHDTETPLEPSLSMGGLRATALGLGTLCLVAWVTPLEVLVGSRGDGVRRQVVVEGSRPVHQLRETLEVGAWKDGWRVRHLSAVTDGAFSVWLVPPGDDAETVPVILYDVDARAPRCEPTKLVVPDLRACLPETGKGQDRVLELLKTQL